MSETTGKLAKKLAEVMAAVDRVPKNGRNEFHKYDYATEADIAAAVRQELAKRHVVILPSVVSHEREADITTLGMEFLIVDGESGESFSRPWLGVGQDKGDKGGYKAMTGGEKTFLLKLFLIPTGDDPEAEDTEKPRQQQTRPAAQQTAPVTRPVTPRPEPGETHGTPQGEGWVKVLNVKSGKTGTNNRGPWTLWIVSLSDGREATTLDDKIAAKAREAQRSGVRVAASVLQDGNRLNLTNVVPVSA